MEYNYCIPWSMLIFYGLSFLGGSVLLSYWKFLLFEFKLEEYFCFNLPNYNFQMSIVNICFFVFNPVDLVQLRSGHGKNASRYRRADLRNGRSELHRIHGTRSTSSLFLFPSENILIYFSDLCIKAL